MLEVFLNLVVLYFLMLHSCHGIHERNTSLVCKEADEYSALTITCPAWRRSRIGTIVFASYGTPTGSCGSYTLSSCHSQLSLSVVESLCVGHGSCSVDASNDLFEDPCSLIRKRLYVAVYCKWTLSLSLSQEENTATISAGATVSRTLSQMLTPSSPPSRTLSSSLSRMANSSTPTYAVNSESANASITTTPSASPEITATWQTTPTQSSSVSATATMPITLSGYTTHCSTSFSHTIAKSSYTQSRSASKSVSSTLTVPAPPTPPKLVVSSATQATTQSATAVSILSSISGGPGSASDIQAMVVVTLARCSAEASARSNGGYQLLTPFALSDSAGGALAGNAVAFGSLLGVQLAALVYMRRVRGQPLGEALASSRLPGYCVMLTASLHQSTLFCAIRLAGGDGDGVKAVDSLMGLVALLVSLAFPVGCVAAAAKVPRRFVQYECGVGTRFVSMPWRLLVPAGTTLPHGTRLMASPVITAFALASPLCVGSQFVSSFLSNLVALLPASAPSWLCYGAIFFSAVAHFGLGVAVAVTGMHRFPSSRVLNTCGLLLVGSYHAMIAWYRRRDGIDVMMTMQAGLSFVRTVAAVGITVLEGKMLAEGSGVELTKVLWQVGGYGERELSVKLLASDDKLDASVMMMEMEPDDVDARETLECTREEREEGARPVDNGSVPPLPDGEDAGTPQGPDDLEQINLAVNSSENCVSPTVDDGNVVASVELDRQEELCELQETTLVERPFGIGEVIMGDDLRRIQLLEEEGPHQLHSQQTGHVMLEL